jgi:pyruvate/oxaloacetate carboxyltransferase
LSTTTEVDELHQLINELRRCVTSLVSMHGDCPAMRRLVNDAERIVNGVDRLDIDLEELEMKRGHNQPDGSTAMIQIPDTEYHIDFWRDVDHEGVGGQR